MAPGQGQPREQNHEVVISGMAGVFPESDDVDELWSRLINKDEDMVSVDNRRWIPGEMGVPAGVGKVREPNHFDMSFFGVSRRLCINMDPLTKLCLEQSFRAICDAGVNPRDLSGALTASLMASVTSETEYDCVMRGTCQGHAMLGHSRTMQANRISYFLNLKGPSLMMDSSWCGGLQGLQYAHDLISGGHATSALVGAASLVYRPEVSIHYQSMGRLSNDNKTRCFSADASGYSRSEGVVVFFLQRKEHARRSYGTILSVLALSVGSREITFPEFSGEHYRKLLKDSYERAKATPKDLGYIEAYSGGCKEIESRELNAVADVLVKERTKPLPVGCIKSNLGHCEGASSLVGAIKIAMILDRGVIPPNINYGSPNPKIPALLSGDLKVVTKVMPLEGDLVATTEIGAAGNMGHVIMKRHDKSKPKKPVVGELPPDGIPRLVLMSDRSEENLKKNNERLMTMAVDEEFVCLMNHVYRNGIKGHLYRGYTVLNGEENKFKQIEKYEDNETKRPIWFMFSGMGSQWPEMGRELMKLPVFAAAVQKCHDTLAPKGVNVLDILTKDDPSMFDTILHSFVGIAAVQIGLVDILKALGIEPDGIVGHSVGELGCAYADGCFTAEQMILSAYARGRASVEAELIRGMMAAVGKGYNEIKNEIPPEIEVACHNSSTSCTLSGPTDVMEKYIGELKEKGIFAKLVNVANIAYHSRYIKPAAPALLRYLKEVIPEPKPRSSRWVSSSIPDSQWDSDLAKTSSAEYHTNNLLGSVLFEEATEHIPSDAIIIEIAPHGLLQAIVKRSLKDAVHIPLTNKFEDGLMYLLGAIGKMYIHGIPVDVQTLFPPVEFPVSRETPAISPFVGWQHSEEFVVEVFDETSCRKVPCWKELSIVLTEERFSTLGHHKIKDRVVLPPSFYIGSIIDIYSDYDHGTWDSCIAIENFNCQQEVEIPKSTVDLFAQVNRGTGNFSFYQSGKFITKGRIVKLDKSPLTPIDDDENTDNYLDGKEMLQFLNKMGLNLTAKFAAIEKFQVKDTTVRAVITWNGSIIEFLKNAFTLVEFYDCKKHNELRIVSQAVRMLLDLPVLESSSSIWVEYNATTRFIRGNGIQVLIPETVCPALAAAPTKNVEFSLETYQFVPSINPNLLNVDQIMSICSQLVVENIHQSPEKSCVIRVVGIGSPSPFLQSLNNISESMRISHSFHITSVSGEEEFFLRDMSFIHQEIIWVISSGEPSQKLCNALNSALYGFTLAPKNAQKDNTIKSMIEFNHEGKSYDLGTSVKALEGVNYTIVHTGKYCIETLRNTLQKAVDENWKQGEEKNLVILAGKMESITSTIAIIEGAENLPQSFLLRYLATDQGLPPSLLDDNHIRAQISKNLKQNIFKNGVWGSLRRLPVSVKPKSISRGEKFLYPLSSLTSSGDIKTLGLNLSDVTGSLANDSLSVFDYVTSNQIGVATYDPKQKAFFADQVLKWSKPESWTSAEAATVPLLYSLAATIIYFKENPYQGGSKNIFITDGSLPLSQAIITLALHENMDVFTTVENETEKTELSQMFPKLKRNQILDHGNNDFYIHIRRLTEGKGIDKIVFTLDGEDKIAAATKCLPSQYGTVILVSKAPMEANSNFGMLMFLEEGAAMGVTAETMLSISYKQKIQLKEKVKDLINSGVIRPFKKYNQLPSSALNVEATSALQQSQTKLIYQPGVSEAQNIPTDKFICDKKKSYVLICGKEQLDLWIDLAEWLLKRDARKLNIFLTQMTLTTVNALRYQSLTKQYHGAKVNLHSIKHLSSKESMTRYFNDIAGKEGIDTIFLIGTDLSEKAREIDDIFRIQQSDGAIVSLGNGGEIVAQQRHDDGLRSLCVRCGRSALSSPDILRYFEQLLLDSAKQPVVMLTEQVQRGGLKGTGAKDGFYIPETLPELRELLRLTETQPKFKPIPTHTARLPFIKEIWSVFIIPGLRPGQTFPLCSQLFNPALEARLPEDTHDIDELASQYVNQMTSSRITCFTLVADGWGGILALHIAAKLEALGMYAKVILLNTTPLSIKKMAADLIKDDTALIDRYLKLSSKTECEVRSKGSWEEKLQAAISGANLDETEGATVARAITLLRNRLNSVLTASIPSQKIRTKAHVFEYGSDFQETGKTGLSEYLAKEHILHLIGGETVEECMASAANGVNTLVLFEYKDAANPPIEDRLGVNILKTTCFDT